MFFFQVIMLINLVKHVNRSQMSCSQCYNSIFTFNQQKKSNLNIEIDEKLVRYSLFVIGTLTFFSSYHAYKSSLAC